jgi:galactonate dehydratase
MAELWFSPSQLHFSTVHVRGKTNWVSFELGDSEGTFGSGEITATQLASDVAPVVARLANKLRGEKLSSDDDVLKFNRLQPADLEKDVLLATAVSGLRCAVADALAKRAQLPLHRYIRQQHGHAGDPANKVRLYANINRSMLPNDRGPVDRSPETFGKMAERAMKAGFITAKCAPFDECRGPHNKVGLPNCASLGLERVRAAKDAVGPDRTLYVDCHSRFDLNSGFALGEELKVAGAGWYEEPVDPIDDMEVMRQIHARSPLPNAGAEMGYGVAIFERLMQEDVLDIVMPDVKFCGGPVEAYRIGMELEPNHPGSVSMHCPSGPLSLLASAHATAAFGNVLPLEHAVYEVEWRHEVMEPFEQIKNGEFFIPDGFGLGGRVDPVAVELRGRRWDE